LYLFQADLESARDFSSLAVINSGVIEIERGNEEESNRPQDTFRSGLLEIVNHNEADSGRPLENVRSGIIAIVSGKPQNNVRSDVIQIVSGSLAEASGPEEDGGALYPVRSSAPSIINRTPNKDGVQFVKPQIGGRRLEDEVTTGSDLLTTKRSTEAGEDSTQLSEVATVRSSNNEVITESIQGEFCMLYSMY
jgi:hypothetical protein